MDKKRVFCFVLFFDVTHSEKNQYSNFYISRNKILNKSSKRRLSENNQVLNNLGLRNMFA